MASNGYIYIIWEDRITRIHTHIFIRVFIENHVRMLSTITTKMQTIR